MNTFGRRLKRKIGHSLGPIRRGITLSVVAGKIMGTNDSQDKENLKVFAKRLQRKNPPKFSFSEALHNSFINRDKIQVDIHKNPSRKDLNQHCSYIEKHNGRPTGNKESGVFLHHDNMYTFDRYGTLHGEAARHIENHDEHHLPIYLYHNGVHAHALITDASRHTKWHHNPEAKKYIQNHPQMKKHFKHIEVSYYDDAIHGDWHDMKEKK